MNRSSTMLPHDICINSMEWKQDQRRSFKQSGFASLPSTCNTVASKVDTAPTNVDPFKQLLDVETHLDNVSRILQESNIDYIVPEPTPIGPNNIEVVEQVPLGAAPWHQDQSIFSTLYSVLIENSSDRLTSSMSRAQLSNESMPFLSRENYDGNDESTVDSKDNSSLANDTNYSRRWNERYQDLLDFMEKFGHCLVPLNWPPNPALGHWVKRQRYQYSLKSSGTHSTLTKDREEALEKLGFVWDSHAALWEERWNELREFKVLHGHCNVPSRYPANQKLSIWVKCQRRQYKLLISGQKSNMTQERVVKLRRLGLALGPRRRK